ncbi:major outer membrane protein [Nostoc sp. NIES-3756]|uniref:iron uptake porin n=1 Tax=Nostoc sp. NIES-3756 TaxID=1751286 RepID=UPI000720681F|nr:iron uptake porin [Nostoc sp. NIES-3756]BAT54884.1 major outer membrane protein [Nostoc sp. NIES-3756]
MRASVQKSGTPFPSVFNQTQYDLGMHKNRQDSRNYNTVNFCGWCWNYEEMRVIEQLFVIYLWCLCLISHTSYALAQPSPNVDAESEEKTPLPITPVNQLQDVKPQDWAFTALQSLAERYGVELGYPNGTFQGNRAMSRYEFASGVNAVLEQVDELISLGKANLVTTQDFETLQRLQEAFATELAVVQKRVDTLEAQTTRLEANQFSTTTKLLGQAIFAINAGSFDGDRIIAPRGRVISEDNPNATFIYRASLDLNTSFYGTDLLKIRLVTGSDGANDNAGGFLEPNLGSTLDFSIPGRDGQFSIARLYYTFTPLPDLQVTVGPAIVAGDFVDKNRYANNSFLDFSTQALINNYILLPRPAGAGAFVEWQPKASPLKLRGLYVSGDATNSLPENEGLVGGGTPEDIRLFPIAGGGAEGGLFGDPYQGFVELEYAPNRALAVRLQYSGGRLFGSSFQGFGVNFDLALNNRVGLFGRYGYASYPNTSLGDIEPNYWMAGVGFRDLFVNRAIAGIAIGQPFIESSVGNTTQTNFEAFYNFPVNDNIRVAPLIQVITHPSNQNSNNTIITGTLRTVFSF